MKRFAILRDIPDTTTWEEVDAAAIENMIKMGMSLDEREFAWEPRVLGVSWVRSYWQQGTNWGTCLYEAPDEDAVRNWHDLCQVPYAGIREIEVVEGSVGEDEYPRGFHAPAQAAPLLAVEAASPAVERDGFKLVRSYRFIDNGEELQLFLAPENVESSPPGGGIVRPVVELRPTDYS